MKTYTVIIEKCPQIDLFVGHAPSFIGVHSQGATLDELNRNMQEAVEMLLEDSEPRCEKSLSTSGQQSKK